MYTVSGQEFDHISIWHGPIASPTLLYIIYHNVFQVICPLNCNYPRSSPHYYYYPRRSSHSTTIITQVLPTTSIPPRIIPTLLPLTTEFCPPLPLQIPLPISFGILNSQQKLTFRLLDCCLNCLNCLHLNNSLRHCLYNINVSPSDIYQILAESIKGWAKIIGNICG